MIGNKESVFKMRLTDEEKENLRKYAEKHGITMTEAIRQLCEEIFNNTEEK